MERFLTEQAVPGRVYIIRDIPAAYWRDWKVFLTDYTTACSNAPDHPHLIVIVPHGLSHSDIYGVSDRDGIFVWTDILSRSDMSQLAEQLDGRPRGILEKFARATSVELAGPDTGLLRLLLKLPLSEQIKPNTALRRLITSVADKLPENQPITWEEGVVYEWSGEVEVNTIRLGMDRRWDGINHRIWKAHLPIAMETTDLIRESLIRRHFSTLNYYASPTNPFEARRGQKTFLKKSPHELEVTDIIKLHQDLLDDNKGFLWGDDWNLARFARNMRHAVAHMEPVDERCILSVTELWKRSAASRYSQGEIGWDWARCEQKATVLIGPAGAGKSSWAQKQKCTVISRDDVRHRIKLKQPNIPEGIILDAYLSEAIEVLKSGRDVIMDATHIDQHVRYRILAMVPADIPIDYVVIDRPIDEKIRDGGWRNAPGKQGMIKEHHDRFLEEIDAILSGDGDKRVTVIDQRKS